MPPMEAGYAMSKLPRGDAGQFGFTAEFEAEACEMLDVRVGRPTNGSSFLSVLN